MCSFIVTFIDIIKIIDTVNKYMKSRGPDKTTVVQRNGFIFLHNLLHITGQATPQPFIHNNIVAIYNGEIYNYIELGKKYGKCYQSDGQCIIDTYLFYGEKFAEYLDGEFALVLIDFDKQIAIVSTDLFRTKPLWWSINPKFTVATYESALIAAGCVDRQNMSANKILIFDLSAPNTPLLRTYHIYQFDLKQFKTSYDDYHSAFDRAVKKRATQTNTAVYICLSSGYDSGAIMGSLEKQGIKYGSFSLKCEEILPILQERIQMSHGFVKNYHELSQFEYDAEKAYVSAECEPYTMLPPQTNKLLSSNRACMGLSYIHRLARSQGFRVVLSGQGADEIISNYGRFGVVIEKKIWIQLFPANLSTIFPWSDFWSGSQKNFLAKEELVAGIYGIEARYPFLDKEVVQEFLWLTPELKNQYYKAPLHTYLTKNHIPFKPNHKAGFAADKNLVNESNKEIKRSKRIT